MTFFCTCIEDVRVCFCLLYIKRHWLFLTYNFDLSSSLAWQTFCAKKPSKQSFYCSQHKCFIGKGCKISYYLHRQAGDISI